MKREERQGKGKGGEKEMRDYQPLLLCLLASDQKKRRGDASDGAQRRKEIFLFG